VGASLAEHEQQLASMLTGPPPAVMERQRKFVTAFIRPHGIDTSATNVVSDTLERIAAAERVGPGRESSIVGRLGLRLLTKMESDPRWRPNLLDERAIEREARMEEWSRVRALDRARQRAEAPEGIAELARKREAKARRHRALGVGAHHPGRHRARLGARRHGTGGVPVAVQDPALIRGMTERRLSWSRLARKCASLGRRAFELPGFAIRFRVIPPISGVQPTA